jgi:chlorobactene glucosyltransferase
VSVILPARNEAANLERCARSILASDYPRFDLVIVDDRSTDGTGAIADALAAHDARVRVVHGAELPEGWYGKPWACWQGYRAASGSLLLFTDADTVHGPRLLPRAVAALRAEGADLVTVIPRQEMVGFWERAVQPFFFLMLGLRFGSAQKLNRNTNPRDAIANGQFICVTRASYEAVGGHERVKDTVIEDLMLAVRYTEARRRLFIALAEEDMSTHMYTSLGGIVEGWSKNFFSGVLVTIRARPLAYAAALASLLLPLLFVLPAAALAAGVIAGRAPWLAFGAVGYAGAAALFALFLRAARAPAWYGLFHPLGALVQVFIILRAIARGTRRIEWKGRTYSHS